MFACVPPAQTTSIALTTVAEKISKPSLTAAVIGAAALLFAPFSGHAVTATSLNTQITQAQVEAAQAAWGAALVQISADFAQGGVDKAKKTAETALDSAYGYQLGPVLFKPTLTEAPQTFRTTREGALAYFVGHNEAFPQDGGFALKGWTDVTIDNAAIFISGDTALTMGNVRLTNKDGTVTTVDKTWGFQKDDAGNLRIVLHHSSLPYSAK